MNEKMNEESNNALSQQLSALVDGELEALELRRLLKQLNALPSVERDALYQTWGHYQLIAEALHEERGEHVASASFAASVCAAIDAEPTHGIDDSASDADEQIIHSSAAVSANHSPVWARFAVAASVALAVIVGVQQYQLNEQFTGAQIANSAVIREVPAMLLDAPAKTASSSAAQYAGLKQTVTSPTSAINQPLSSSPVNAAEAQQRLNEYLVEHAKHATQQAGSSTIPLAHLANFEDE